MITFSPLQTYNFAITQSVQFFRQCVMVQLELCNGDPYTLSVMLETTERHFFARNVSHYMLKSV